MVLYGMCGIVWYDMVCMVWYGMVLYGMCGMVWYGMVCMVWYGRREAGGRRRGCSGKTRTPLRMWGKMTVGGGSESAAHIATRAQTGAET